MKYIFLFGFILSMSFATFAQNYNNIEAVSEAFGSYKKFMMEAQGDASVDLLSSNSIEYYDNILDKTKSASKEEVMEMSVLDMVTVLGARHKLTASEAQNMDGAGFFKYGVETGLIGKDIMKGLDIANIDIEEDKASALIMTNGIETPVKLAFNKENNIWKVDISSIYASANDLINNLIAMTGQSKSEFALSLIERNLGEKPSDTIWNPLSK